MAQPWATQFLNRLLRDHVVVLVGYGADDPPVKYLLQGLDELTDARPRSLYTFDMGDDEAQVRARWLDRNVKSIAYPNSKNHASLWNTLFAWAKKAENVLQWQQQTVALAAGRPETLYIHQRQQVTYLVNDVMGALNSVLIQI